MYICISIVNVPFKKESVQFLILFILRGTYFTNPFQFSKIILFFSSFLQKNNSFISKLFLSLVFFWNNFWFCKRINMVENKPTKIKNKSGSWVKVKPLQLSLNFITMRWQSLPHDMLWILFIDTKFITTHFTCFVKK